MQLGSNQQTLLFKWMTCEQNFELLLTPEADVIIAAVLFLVFTQISAPHIVLYPAGSSGTLRMRACKTQAPPIVAPESGIHGI